jgi:hypothetical protein
LEDSTGCVHHVQHVSHDDSFIVPIPRPTGWDAQKPVFSKKHHQHALIVQIVTVNRNVACLSPPEVVSVSDSSLLERNPIPVAFNQGNVYGDKAYNNSMQRKALRAAAA